MANIGRFVITRELQRQGLSQVLLARDSKRSYPGEIALKVMRSTGTAGAAADASAIQGMVNAASLQQNIAGSGAARWASVLEYGTHEDATYVAYEAYPGSVASMIDSKAEASGAAILNLLRSIAGGLLESKAIAGRGHGNISPDNILLRQPAALQKSEIALTDPEPEIEFNEETETADRCALGNVVYELVEGKPFKAMGQWPLEFAGKWTLLGRDGALICDIVNRLLDPELSPGQVPWTEVESIGRGNPS